VKSATLKIYEGAPHGLATTRSDELNSDLLAFIESGARYVGVQSEGASRTH
jgi:non-heme chloroperoxidase